MFPLLFEPRQRNYNLRGTKIFKKIKCRANLKSQCIPDKQLQTRTAALPFSLNWSLNWELWELHSRAGTTQEGSSLLRSS